VVLLLIDDRRPERPAPRRPEHLRVPWRVVPSTTATVSFSVVAATTTGPVAAFAAIGALCSFFRVLDRALPYKQGLREYRQ